MKEREEYEPIMKLTGKDNLPMKSALDQANNGKMVGHLETPDAGPNNEPKNPSDCGLKKKTEDSPQSSLPIAKEDIDGSVIFLDCKIENRANQCFIINKNRKRVYAGSGKLKILDGKIYRIVYNRSAISIHHLEWDEKREKFRLGEKIVYEQKDSSLYKSLDNARYLEQIKAITFEQISGEYKVEVDDSYHGSTGEKPDLVESKRVIPTKPRKEPKPKKECSSDSQAVLPKCDLKIVDISQQTIAVTGNIKPHTKALKAMGAYTVILIDGQLAWVFSSHKRKILQAYINGETSAIHSWEDKRMEKTPVYFRDDKIKEKSQRKRSPRFVIRVEYPNGKVFFSKDIGVTLVDVIHYAGPEKVRQLNIICLGDNLVSHRLGKNSIYRAAQKKIDNGLYVCICASEEMIYRQILRIDYGCRLGLKVEKEYIGGHVPLTKKKTKRRRNATKKRIETEDDFFEEWDDAEDDIYKEDISKEGKIGDTIRLLPSQRMGEIIGTRIDHEGYERLVIRTEDYHLIEIDNNPYLFVVLKQK